MTDKKLKIWLATVGEPLPIDGDETRLLRTGQFAQWLSDHGHSVTFFTNSMDHYARKLRTQHGQEYTISPNYKIITLSGRSYKHSISIARFLHHKDVAKSFRQVVSRIDRPDVILTSFPIEELCRAIMDYAKSESVPVAIDTRDLWPDIFAEILPNFLRNIASAAIYPLIRSTRQTYARADAITGITESMLDWGLEKAGRARSENDFWFPFSYQIADIIKPTPHKGLHLCFLGTISQRSNLEMIIEAMRLLQKDSKAVSLEICGSGEAENSLIAASSDLTNVSFRGWLNKEGMKEVMRRSDFGVLPYNRADFHQSLPNKYVEYLAVGLPILSCTEGEVERHLARSGAGLWVKPSPKSIADALSNFDHSRLQNLQSCAINSFKAEFSPDAVFQKALNGLQRLLRR